MADYVRKTILSQGYAHILKIKLTPEQKTDYEVSLRTYQESRAKMMMASSIVPEVKTKDGSLKVYATVYGTVTDAIGDVSEGFMEALNSLYVSSKMLADACIVEGLFLSGAPRRNLVRSESRTGVVKTTKDLFDMTSAAAKAFSEDGEKRINSTLLAIETKLIFLNDQLTDVKDKNLIFSNYLIALDELPKTPDRLLVPKDTRKVDAYKVKIASLKKMSRLFSEGKDLPGVS